MKIHFLTLAAALYCCLSTFAAGEPKLLLHLTFDGEADPQPLEARNLNFEPGLFGQALRSTQAEETLLKYPVKGNLDLERGTIALWVKPMWDKEFAATTDRRYWHTFLITDRPSRERGNGTLWFWSWGNLLRGGTSDKNDAYRVGGKFLKSGVWQHVAYTWDETGHDLYVDGKRCTSLTDGESPLKVDKRRQYNDERDTIENFYIGGNVDGEQADALLDEFRIYSAPLSEAQIRALAQGLPWGLELLTRYRLPGAAEPVAFRLVNRSRAPRSFQWHLADEAGGPVGSGQTQVLRPGSAETVELQLPELPPGRYLLTTEEAREDLWVLPEQNAYSGGDTLEIEPLETVQPSQLGPERFLSIGDLRMGTLEGNRYLEAGSQRGDRFAIRFRLPDAESLYLFEWDYPDDKKRTCDIIAQSTRFTDSEYEFQVGYCAGDEYPNTHQMLTTRALYIPRSTDVTLVFMTARHAAPAAVGEIRVFKVTSPLPPVQISTTDEAAGPTRSVGIYYEDPAINYGLGADGCTMPGFATVADRLTAYMKYSGQNLLVYPVVWYHGFIDEVYNPRRHVPDFLELLLTRLDTEKLEFMASMNRQTTEIPVDLVNATSVADGSLHQTAVSILSDGKPNPGRWHGSPPNFNILHPDSRKIFFEDIDRILEIGVKHPSFKGILLHLPRHGMYWFGDIESGYNDYTVRAFERETGIRVPVDRKSPMRGKLYADWLLANRRDQWVDWRCRKLAALYREAADRISARRSDLRLVINSMVPVPQVGDPRFTDPGFVAVKNREAGLDPKYFAGASNIVLDQTVYPADYRWRSERNDSESAKKHLRVIDTHEEYYELLLNARNPWLHLHDRYWESAIGSSAADHWSDKPNALTAPWFKEQIWRVSTLNPAGRHSMRHYVLPLRYTDLTGMTKGGFLVGTYGLEEYLTPFIKAFRALPAERFQDMEGGSEFIRARTLESGGFTWFYVVNTHHEPGSANVSVEGAYTDLLTGSGGEGAFVVELEPYEFRSYRASAGTKVEVRCP